MKILAWVWDIWLILQIGIVPISLLLGITQRSIKGGGYFWFVQNVSIVCTFIGWFVLIPMAATRFWVFKSNNEFPGRVLAQWRGGWLTFVFGNLENGVLGTELYAARIPNERLRAYLWSAWRNSANNLRFIFRWRNSNCFYRWENAAHTYYFQCGFFQDNGFPVLSAGRIQPVGA